MELISYTKYVRPSRLVEDFKGMHPSSEEGVKFLVEDSSLVDAAHLGLMDIIYSCVFQPDRVSHLFFRDRDGFDDEGTLFEGTSVEAIDTEGIPVWVRDDVLYIRYSNICFTFLGPSGIQVSVKSPHSLWYTIVGWLT
jgi:hypothetical protein